MRCASILRLESRAALAALVRFHLQSSLLLPVPRTSHGGGYSHMHSTGSLAPLEHAVGNALIHRLAPTLMGAGGYVASRGKTAQVSITRALTAGQNDSSCACSA